MSDKPDGLRPGPGELADAIAVLRPELNQQIGVAVDYLLPYAQQDCYGSESDGPCDCQVCETVRAIEVLREISRPAIRSLKPERLNYAELVYFEAWVRLNTEQNGKYGLLELLLRQLPLTVPVAEYVSQRDMDVATLVVQWLGTNVGRGFVEQCEQEWAARREERQDYEHAVHLGQPWAEYRNKSKHQKVADSIVEKYHLDHRNKTALKADILKAMLYAQTKAVAEDLENQF